MNILKQPGKLFCFLLSMALSLPLAQSQDFQVGVMGGAAAYNGDLSGQKFGVDLKHAHFAGGAFGRLNVGTHLAFRLGISAMKVSGADSEANGRPDRGLNFRSRITEFALTAELNLFRMGYPDGFNVMPFAYAGGALFKYNPEALFDGQYIELQPLGTEAQGVPGYAAPYKLTEFAIPFGGGLKFNFGNGFTLGLEMGARKLFTDYLDDISSATINYLDVLEGNGRIAATLSNPAVTDPSDGDFTYRRGGKFDDWYFTGGVTLAFRLAGGNGGYGRRGREMGCPVW